MPEVIRVSGEGDNIVGLTIDDTAFHSEYKMPLLEESMVGTTSYLFDTDIGIGDRRNIFTLAHNYGYIPRNIAQVTIGSDFGLGIISIPLPYYSGFSADFTFEAYCDNTNFYIDMIGGGVFGGEHDDSVYYFKYYIFTDRV